MKQQIPGGLADNQTFQTLAKRHNTTVDQIKKELKKGVEVELEHTEDKHKALEIAMDHVYEDPNYYKKLKKANL